MVDTPALDDLLNHYQPQDGQAFSSDPAGLADRLSRKLSITPSRVGDDIDFTPKTKKPEKAESAPDLSSLGEAVPEPSSDDLSSLGTPVQAPETPASKPGVLATLGQGATALGKGLARGAPEAIGSMSQGAAALAGPVKPETPDATSMVDELGNVPSMTPSERAKLVGRALRTIGDRGLQMDFNGAVQRIARGGDPKAEIQTLRDKFSLQNSDQYRPVDQQIRYQAGANLKKGIDEAIPATPEEQASVPYQVGAGISGVAPYVAAGIALGPEAGLLLGAAGMGAQTAGDTFESAKARGANDDQAVNAAGWGAGIGAALGAAPLAAVFKPVTAASNTWKSWLAAKLVQAGQSGVTFAGVGEAQQYLLEQVAKQYDPQAGYSPDAKRIISSLITGGAIGALHPLTPKPSDLSSPEAIADFLRKASTANGGTGRTPEEDAAAARGAQTRSEIDDFIRNKDAQAAATAPGLPKPDEPVPPEAAAGGEPETSPSPSGGEQETAPTEQTEIDGLRRYGWSDQEIASMTPSQRRTEFLDAMATGQSAPGESDGSTSSENKSSSSRDVENARTSGVAGHQAALQQSESPRVQELRSTRDQNGSGVREGLPSVSGRSGDEAKSGIVAGQEGQREGLRGGQSPVGNSNGAGSERPEERQLDGQRSNATDRSVGGGNEHEQIRDSVSSERGRDVSRGGGDAAVGTRDAPVNATTQRHVLDAQPAEPTPAQAEAENFKHAHVELEHLGLTGRHSISVETGVGGIRKGPIGEDGKPAWQVTMPVAYGRIKGTKGADGQPLDIFIGPVPTSPHVFIVDQHHNEGGFDEHKIMAGFPGPDAALRAFADSYEDKGGNRIGHVTALTPDQFKDWMKGDTTQPLKKALSEQEIGNLFDEIVGGGDDKKGGEPEALSQVGSPQLPREVSDGGRSPLPAGAVDDQGQTPKNGEIIPPGRLYVEPTQEFHDQIEAVLGADYHHVLPVDTHRAAEILAENPAIPPHLAFQYAVIENAAAQKFLTPSQLEQIYGPEVKALLEPGREGTHIGGEPVEQEGTTSDQGIAGGSEAGVVPGGGETGEPERGTKSENGEQPDAGRKKPDTKRKARGGVAEEVAAGGETKTAEGADKSERDQYLNSEEHKASRAVEDALNMIEEAVEAGDRPAVLAAAKVARKLIVDTPQAIKGADPEYWGQFGPLIRKMTKPGYVTGKQEHEAEFNPSNLVAAFAERLNGDGFKNILDARRLAKEYGVDDLKSVEESLELAVVKAAREIVKSWMKPYPSLVALYEKQPRLGTRTSTSVRDQAYSTPVPLGYLAQKLAGVTKESTVYEPTAGNGALLTAAAADSKKVLANEINPQRSKNLKDQGFLNTEWDASTRLPKPERGRFDVVIANPPFGPVKENGESKVFDMSDIQPGYKTTEIDHAIALRALEGLKPKGRAVLLLGGLNKQVTTPAGRSAGYNGKAKREFYLTLYSNYDVTDHFTVNGDLYERQGAGWPVDVIVINGRGKSSRALPAVDVPRIYDSWESLGGLLDGQDRSGNVAADERPDVGAAGARGRLEVGGQPDRGSAGSGQPSGRNGRVEPASVREKPVSGQPEVGALGGNRDQAQSGRVPDRQPIRSGEQPAAERSPSRLSADQIGDIFDELVPGGDDDGSPPADRPTPKSFWTYQPTGETPTLEQAKAAGAVAADSTKAEWDKLSPGFKREIVRGKERSAAQAAKSAAKNAVSAADEALSGLTQLFGGGKTIGSGLNFDEDTYAKARPMFERAAEKFSDFKYDIRELMKRMIDHLKDAYAWTTETLKNARPYIVRFIQDVQDGVVDLNKAAPAEEPAKPVEQPKTTTKAAETAGQAVYEPQSKMPGLDTLVPVNMKKSIADALAALEKKVGPIDDFVAKELGWSKDELEKYLGAEQVDAVALAVDELKQGSGFIIGDQTGIGKGRVNASIIKWALRNDRIPIFTTEKPGLYADMFRDMTDIGMEPPRILATNAGLSMPLDDANKNWIKTGDSKKHNALMMGLSNPEEFRKRFDMVFTNYSQMQTLKGESTDRRRFLSAIIPSSTIIFDESHNAGGQVKERKAKGIAADRADFARDLVNRANGVFYSSATYAKRPDVMSLYAATDMAMAVENINDLGEAISKGGIPMQQVVASMLAKAGQYMRRERSFSGINYNTPSVAVSHDKYDQISHALAAIQEFSEHAKVAAKEISGDLKSQGEAIGHDNAVSDAGASSTNFTSVMHNIINQMLLAMKAPQAARMAIEHIKNGEKPVLTVANTMESFLKDYADTLDIKPGDEIDADFADVLMKYLDRSRRITIRKPFGKEKEYHVLTDMELGREGVDAYNNTKAMIAQMDLAHLPISPIDHLKGELQKAGYDVGEITGRGLTIDYTGDKPVLRVRPGGEITTKGRNETRRRFNMRPEKGGLHAIIINQAGSTGISMHAGERFDDKSKRRMMIVQPEANIDTHMQLLGRVNRTGQVVLPEYDQLVANIPAEKRPAAVLAKKMASLNANTTASRTSAVTAKDVPDFMNQYGDMVAANYLSDNFDFNERLAWPVKPGEGKLKSEDAMRKLTGRIPLLPLAEQEALYEHLEEEYTALIKQIEASGASPLEAKTLDLKARTLETSEVQGPKNGSGSPFAAPVNVEKVSVLRQGKPFKPHELMNMLGQRASGDKLKAVDFDEKADQGVLADMLRHFDQPHQSWGRHANQIEHAERTAKVNEFNSFVRPLIEKTEGIPEQEKERVKYNAIKDRWIAIHTMLPVGKRVRLNMFDSNPVAVVLDITQTGKTKNPLALGSWKVHFAVADASRQMILPFSRLYMQGQADPESVLDVEVVPTNETAKDTLARFEMMQSGAREERYIATGNLLAAYDWLNMKGSILNYTDSQGAVHQGIMTPKEFKLGDHAIRKGRIVSDPAELKTLLDQNQTVWSKDRQANISRADRWSDNYQIQTEKKKATGGRYYLDPELVGLTGDFYSRGGMMSANLPGKSLPAAIKRMQEIGAQFTVAAAAPKAQKVEQPPEPPDDEPPSGGGGASLASRADIRKLADDRPNLVDHPSLDEIKGKLNAIVRRVVGPDFDVKFNFGMIRDNAPTVGYGADTKPGAAAMGTYSLDKPLIRLALHGNEDGMRTAAYHESYHAIEDKLQTDTERRLMEQETPRLREWIKGKTGLNDYRVDQLAGFEVRAIAFQLYSREREDGKPQAGAGIHIMVRRWFDRLHDLLRQIGNVLRGYGFKTYKDVFGEAFEGGFADREHGPGSIDVNSLAAMADIFRQQDTAVSGRLRDVMNAVTMGDRIKEKVQNLNEGVRRLEDAVQARMEGEIPDSKAFYQKKRLFPGKVATEVQDFNKQHLDPLIDTLKARGLTLDQVGDILYAQHAAERNAYIDTINPEAEGAGSGMSNEEAQAILDRYDSRDLEEIAHRIDGIRDFVLDTMVNAGLESRATTNAWRSQYAHYVPLGGFAEPREDEETFRESGKFNVRGREVKNAFGRRSKADNPLLNILDQAYRTIERAKKNEYLRALHLALRGLDPDDLKGFVQFDQGKPRREIDPRTGLVRWVDDSSYRFSPKAVAYKVGGNTRYMVFEKQSIADVMRRMHPDALNGVGQALLNMQNKLKAMWTHYSPEFLIRHFLFRYPIEGTMNSFEQGPSNVPRYMADSIPFLGRASKAIFASNKGIVHPDAETAQYQRYWQEMREAGGAMAFRQARDVDLLREHLQKKLAAISGRPLASVMDKHRAAVEAMDTVTNALDNSLRLAAYATARRQGKTPEQAAIVARDATVDFQQAGAWKNAMGLWFPFGNIAIQTGARMGSAVGRSKTMRRVFAGTVMAGFLSGMFNYLVGGDDKDHIPFFDKLPEWEKHLNLTVMNPFHHDDKGRPVPLHVPLPYNWAFPFAIGQSMATMAFSKTKGAARKMIAMAIKAGVEAFSPFAEEGNLAATLAPEITRPLVHTYTNQNWTGTPVHLDPNFQKGPRSESGFKSTGDGWKYSTRMLNTLSGGDKHHSGYLDMFPEDLRELFDYYSGTGTQRGFVTNAVTTATNAASGAPTDYSKIPMARVVMGTNYDAADRARRQENSREQKRPWER